MKLDKLVGERFRERPAGCVIESHALMVRGGYMKGIANGIFSQYPPLRRVTRKLEQIIREEMDAIEGQEVSMPVVLPGALWEESGRYVSVGSELLRFQDRTGTPMVLGMTHEEAAVQLVREYGRTAARYPFMIYQIQTKFRDEARPRGGLIRVREFTMKDAYSFHTSQQDLERYYARCHRAYERIFARAGLPEVVSVASDSGMMGGSISHEFMLLTPIGEDSIAICGECGYRANMEAAFMTAPLALVTVGEHIADVTAAGNVCRRDFIHDPGLHRSLFGDGVASVIAAFFGGAPVTTYSENIGIMALTKVCSVSVVFLAACIAIVISFFAPVNAVITGIPTPVLGGISILLFGIIAITGIRIYMDAHIDFSSNRNAVIALCVIVLGLGGASISFHTGGLYFEMPSIAVATFTGIFLNLLLPGDRNQLKPV